jgi:lipid-A-disaccharide synthase
MLAASRHFPDYQFIVAMAPGMDDAFYKPFLAGYENVSAVGGLTYDLLRQARAAMVTSGTATLETALFGVPEVVCYKGNPISYAIAKRLITIKYISLVNLIMDKPVLTELIQHDLQEATLVAKLKPLLQDEAIRQAMAADYAGLRQLLAGGGHASDNAARLIGAFLKQ